MAQYDFVNPAAAFSSGLEKMLLQREMQKRQALLDSLTQKKTEADIARGQEATQLAQSGQDLAREQFGYRQQRDTTEDTFRNDQARQAAQDRVDQAQAQRDFLAGQNELNRQSKAEQAQHDRDMRETIARLAASNSAASRDVADQLKRMQIATAQDKLQTAQEGRAQAEQVKQQGRSEVYNLANELMTDKNLSSAVGPIDARFPTFLPGTADFESRAARLKNLLSLENRSKLKGQGAVSDFEGRMLESAATSLNPAAGEAAYKKELQRIMEATKPQAGKVLKYNPATGKVE